jgi:S-adenosylmethionine:tRNA ribosyltransferase-isomerase
MPATRIPEERSLASYDYELPPARIAREPAPERAGSRLLVLDRRAGKTAHRAFRDLPVLLEPGDLLVLNETRVLPARLRARRASGGEAEVLLVRPAHEAEPWSEARRWIAMLRPSGRLRAGAVLTVQAGGGGGPRVTVGEGVPGGLRVVELESPAGEWLERHGEMPLPPYIGRPATAADREDYQTVYARVPGAVAAPTAGMHFDRETLGVLERRGIEIAKLVLHVGPGTFRPILVEDVAEHRVDPEWCEIPLATISALERARVGSRRVVAVGTTVTRALEAWAGSGARAGEPFRGWVDLFLRPPYDFRVVRALVTNFHLPRSSLLVLVSAFAGRERVLAAYREAVTAGYRFYSYGDAMLIV